MQVRFHGYTLSHWLDSKWAPIPSFTPLFWHNFVFDLDKNRWLELHHFSVVPALHSLYERSGTLPCSSQMNMVFMLFSGGATIVPAARSVENAIQSDAKGADEWAQGVRVQAPSHVVSMIHYHGFDHANWQNAWSDMSSMISHLFTTHAWQSSDVTGCMHRSESHWTLHVSHYVQSYFLNDELNNLFAVIAVQNMEASNTIQKDQEVEFSALSGSLSMMSKGRYFVFVLILLLMSDSAPCLLVLNDVLDL